MPRSKKIKPENEPFYTNLSLNIHYYRRRKNMSRDDLADRSGISDRYLSRLESMSDLSSPSLEVLFDIAKALEISPAQLLEQKD